MGHGREYGPDISRGIMTPHEPRPQAIWCNRQCHDDDMLERRRKATMAARVRAVLRRRILRRFRDAAITHDHVFVARTQGSLQSPRISRQSPMISSRNVMVPPPR